MYIVISVSSVVPIDVSPLVNWDVYSFSRGCSLALMLHFRVWGGGSIVSDLTCSAIIHWAVTPFVEWASVWS